MTEFESEVLDDINDFRTDALLSLHGGGANMLGRLENVFGFSGFYITNIQ